MPARRALGLARALVSRASVLREIRDIVRSNRQVIAGPWLGEMGFEVLYWVPFVRWVTVALGLNPARVTAVSRGGPEGWYRDVAAAYVDVFDVMPADRFREANAERRRALGEQKQIRSTEIDDRIVGEVRRRNRIDTALVLHPSLMFKLVRHYWWKHTSANWVERHALRLRLPKVQPPAGSGVPQGSYVAAKFYDNDCFRPSDADRRTISGLVESVSTTCRVISLSVDLSVDDHRSEPGPRAAATVAGLQDARHNLDLQTAIVANASVFVGTYGGFSYLAPLCGVPGVALFTEAGGFDPAHLEICQRTAAQLGTPPLRLRDLRWTATADLVADVQRLAAAT
ncbi:MAG: hypothetical protein AB1806_18130 [Acidobacteriota bacterium]